jgi:hypothetical protein
MRSIEISIPSDPPTAYELVVKAIQVWDAAQLWFKESYFPDGNVYTIVVGMQKPAVLVDFTDYWTVSNYCPSLPLGVDGCTHIHWDVSGNITHAVVFLDTNGLTEQTQHNNSIFLALHEVGHALGLPDLTSSSSSPCLVNDLLCLYYANEYPSTLDLYALHRLADGNRNQTVLLPSTIPYTYYVPEGSLNGATPQSYTPQSEQPVANINAANLREFFLLGALTATTGAALLFVFKKRKHDAHAH